MVPRGWVLLPVLVQQLCGARGAEAPNCSAPPALPAEGAQRCEVVEQGVASCCYRGFLLWTSLHPATAPTFADIASMWKRYYIKECRDDYPVLDGGAWHERFRWGFECARGRGVAGDRALCGAGHAGWCAAPPPGAAQASGPCGPRPPLPAKSTKECGEVRQKMAACCLRGYLIWLSLHPGGAPTFADIAQTWDRHSLGECRDEYPALDNGTWYQRFKWGFECARQGGQRDQHALCGAGHQDWCTGEEEGTAQEQADACVALPPLPAGVYSCMGDRRQLSACCKQGFAVGRLNFQTATPSFEELTRIWQEHGISCWEQHISENVSEVASRFGAGFDCARRNGEQGEVALCGGGAKELCPAVEGASGLTAYGRPLSGSIVGDGATRPRLTLPVMAAAWATRSLSMPSGG